MTATNKNRVERRIFFEKPHMLEFGHRYNSDWTDTNWIAFINVLYYIIWKKTIFLYKIRRISFDIGADLSLEILYRRYHFEPLQTLLCLLECPVYFIYSTKHEECRCSFPIALFPESPYHTTSTKIINLKELSISGKLALRDWFKLIINPPPVSFHPD